MRVRFLIITVVSSPATAFPASLVLPLCKPHWPYETAPHSPTSNSPKSTCLVANHAFSLRAPSWSRMLPRPYTRILFVGPKYYPCMPGPAPNGRNPLNGSKSHANPHLHEAISSWRAIATPVQTQFKMRLPAIIPSSHGTSIAF